ncbi:hypothetical protein ACP70R_031341 [Stipagrostis hirtigluma subsp. patula]
MALRRALGWSEGEVMRPESKPCSRLMRQTAGIFSVGGALAFWVLCRLHYGTKNHSPKEPQVGVMRSNLCELDISRACAALQPRVRTTEYSSL